MPAGIEVLQLVTAVNWADDFYAFLYLQTVTAQLADAQVLGLLPGGFQVMANAA